MKRHICLLVCAFLLLASLLVACGSDTNEGNSNAPTGNTHQHIYGDVWSMDETNHWHAATCKDGTDCATAKASLNAHADADKNSVCDVCGYDYGHTHTYATEWSSDENGHWYAPTCECTIAVKDQASHKDADNDGACDVCEYDGGHEHTFVDAWAMDANKHWHAASCGHSVIEDEEAHDYDDMDCCYVCGYIKGGMTVDKAVNLGEYYSNLVNGGHIDFEYDTWMKYQLSIDYALGANSSHITENNLTFAETMAYWYLLYNGGMFGIEEYADGSIGKAYEPASALIDGYAFSQVFGDDDDAEDTFYGVTALITGLYEMAKANPNGDFSEYIVSYEGVAYYVFSFSSAAYVGEEGATLYQVQVGFALGEDYTYRNVYVSSAKYNCEADENGTTYHTTNLVPNTVYNYAVTQTSGKRDLQIKYTPENIFVTDYDLYEELGFEDVFDENGEWIGTKPILSTTPLGDEITFAAGKTFSMCLANILPETAILNLDNVIVEYEGGDSSYWDGSIMLFARSQGTYTLTIKTAMTTKQLTVVITPAEVSEIYPTVSENGVFADKNAHTVYVDENGTASIIFGAAVNSYAEGSFTAALEAGAQNATLADNGDGTYTLSATATGSWVITITSKANPDISCTLTLTAMERPQFNLTDVLVGKYEVSFFGITIYEITFNPIAADGTAGTVTVVDNNNTGWTGTYDFLYAGGALTYSNVDGVVALPFYLDSALGMFNWNNTPTFSVIHVETEPPVVGAELEGTYHVNFLMDGLYVLTFEGGTLTIEDNNTTQYTGTYTYTGSPATGMTILDENGNESDIVIGVGLDGVPTFQCAGLMLAQPLVAVEGSEPGDDPADDDQPTGPNGEYVVDFYGTILYTLTFDNGMLTVQDDNANLHSGLYTYEVNANGGIDVYKDGELTENIIISVSYDGSYTFQCPELMMAQPLVPSSDNDDEDGENPDALTVGHNSIWVENAWTGVSIDFVAPVTGNYTLAAALGEYNAFIVMEDEYGSEMLELPYEFYLQEGDTITFLVMTDNFMSDTIDLVITQVGGSQGGDTPEDTELVLGENSIYVTVTNFFQNQTKVTFTAPFAGTFTIAWADGEGNGDLYDAFGNWIERMPYTFTLEEGESITFYVQSADWEIEEDFIDVVISEGAPVEEPGMELVLGENSVHVTVVNFFQEQTKVTFTAPFAGTFTIAWADGEYNGDLYDAFGNWIERMPYTFTLEAGESITFYVQSADFMISEDYIDVEIFEGAPVEEAGMELVLGENSVYVTVVNFFQEQTKVTFTAPFAGTFTIAWADGEYNGDLYDAFGNWIERMPYTFTLEAGESITFYVQSADFFIEEDFIELVISEGAPVEEPGMELVLGENSVYVTVVNFFQEQTKVTFTAPFAGTFTIAWADGEGNGDLYDAFGNWIERMPYTFTLEAGESITFYVQSADFFIEEDFIELVISEGAPVEEPGMELVLGENSVHVTVVNFFQEQTKVTFTAPFAGTFTIAWADGEYNGDLYDAIGNWIESMPYTFTLEAGESITFYVQSADWEIAEDYIDLVIANEDNEEETESEMLDGEYRVNFAGVTYYTLIFSQNTLNLTDNNGQVYSGTYTYEIDSDHRFYIYQDGVLVEDIIISVARDGSYTFQCPPLKIPQPLVKYIKPADDGAQTVNQLTLGENAVKVTNGWSGTALPFTAPVTGTYTIAPAEGENNALIIVEDGNVTELINIQYNSYVFAMQEGETRTFIVATISKLADVISLMVTVEETESSEPTDPHLATFTFGENGDAAHKDSSDVGSAVTFTEGDYTLDLVNVSKVYGNAFDATGNSCLKLGTGKVVGTFTFTVADDVNTVVIRVAAYKANTCILNVNGEDYSIEAKSNDGEYIEILVDTAETKTVVVTTVEGGLRAMIDSISYYCN